MGASLLAMILFTSVTATAQTTPRTPDGRINFNGFWNTPDRPNSGRQLDRAPDGSFLFEFSENFDEVTEVCLDDSCQVANQPPYKPEFMPKVKEIAATMYLGTSPLDPNMLCRPGGVPRTGVGSMHVVQTPEVMALLYEGAPSSIYRLIYLDGRAVPDDLETSYMGFSTGRWEGDTLVVKVVGLNEDTWVGGSSHGRAKYTSIHSDKMEVTERWSRNGNTLTVETTVVDPVMFTKPWVLSPRRVQMSSPGDYIRESICTPDNATQANIVTPSEKDKGQLYLGSKANALE
jgi:hypothetical protein